MCLWLLHLIGAAGASAHRWEGPRQPLACVKFIAVALAAISIWSARLTSRFATNEQLASISSRTASTGDGSTAGAGYPRASGTTDSSSEKVWKYMAIVRGCSLLQ